MQWRIALNMHGNITLNGCECMVEKSTLGLVFDWVGLVKGDEIQQSRTVEYCGKENLSRVIESRDRHLLG